MSAVKERIVKLSGLLETVGGLVLLVVMALVVLNVLTRLFFNIPINGTYDLAGLFTSLVVGLSLASCAVHRGHIAIDFFIRRFPVNFQLGVDVVIGLISFIFLLIAAWQIGEYGYTIYATGRKSPSVMIAYYPFVYMVAIGVFFFALIVLVQTLETVRKVTKP